MTFKIPCWRVVVGSKTCHQESVSARKKKRKQKQKAGAMEQLQHKSTSTLLNILVGHSKVKMETRPYPSSSVDTTYWSNKHCPLMYQMFSCSV